MAVAIYVEGIRDIPEVTYRRDIESRLKDAEIRILPLTETKDGYPRLELVSRLESVSISRSKAFVLGMTFLMRLL